MTIGSYSLKTTESESSHYKENPLSTLEDNEKCSKKLLVEVSKTEQLAGAILETNFNKDVNTGSNTHQIIKPCNTKKESWIWAIDCNSKDENAYYHLANLLESNETVQLLNGEIYTKKQLYLKAIELNPQYEIPYCNLADCLNNHETVELLNGKVYTNKELYLKSIDLNPQDEIPYCSLAHCLNNDETVELLNGEIYTNKKLYLKSIDLNPQDEIPYCSLTYCLTRDETVELLSGETYTQKELYLKAMQLNPQGSTSYCNLATLLTKDETVQSFSGEIYTNKKLYLKAIQLNPQEDIFYYNLATLLEDDETIQCLNGKSYTKKDLYVKAIALNPGVLKLCQTRQYLQKFYLQEIERNPKNIENYFELIGIMENAPISLKQGESVDREFLFKEAVDIDPIQAFSARFAPHFLSIAHALHEKTKSLIGDAGNQDTSLRAKLLKEGAFLPLKNGKIFSAKTLYQHALECLSQVDLKRKGDAGIGDYLSNKKFTLLKDRTKFTKIMAYTYAYQRNPSKYTLMKIGDALHPEERVLLNGNFYDQRTCYKDATLKMGYDESLIRQAVSLYPHEYRKRKALFREILENVYRFSQDRWTVYVALARILSLDELKGEDSKYLLVFGENLKNTHPTDDEHFNLSIEERYENLNHLILDDGLYWIKRREFLLKLLTYIPYCEEAYVALAKSFQAPLCIQEKNYTSKESLYLQAIDINPEYSLPYFLLGEELFHQKREGIQLLNGVTLSPKQLLMRAIQLGTYEPKAYHLAALLMHDKEGIMLFDEKTILSRGDLFIRAFELDSERVIDLKNFISYVKRASVKA
ncbi:MAG: hypothetical protein QRY71_05605 [Candidatus Rhabdochlamydia sp.]